MKKLVVTYKGLFFSVICSDVNTHIEDSWRITGRSDMKEFLNIIREMTPEEEAVNKRSVKSMVREWRAHNLLYRLGLFKSHTKDVDLNTGQPWYISVAYFLIGV